MVALLPKNIGSRATQSSFGRRPRRRFRSFTHGLKGFVDFPPLRQTSIGLKHSFQPALPEPCCEAISDLPRVFPRRRYTELIIGTQVENNALHLSPTSRLWMRLGQTYMEQHQLSLQVLNVRYAYLIGLLVLEGEARLHDPGDALKGLLFQSLSYLTFPGKPVSDE